MYKSYTSWNVLTLDILNVISSSKLKYHERLANKFNDPKTAPKTYLAILKRFVNGSKIPLILPLLVDNKLVTEFLGKANLFNLFNSTVSVSINFETREKLSSLEFCVRPK